MKKAILCFIGCFIFYSISYSQDKVNLKYTFQQGEIVQYRTERHDSTSMSIAGQANVIKVNSGMISSLTVSETPPGKPYQITVNIDTSWSDGNQGIVSHSAGSGGGEQRMVIKGGPAGGADEKTLEFDQAGYSAKDTPVTSSFFIPLPLKPVGENDTWEFQYTKKHTGQAKGETSVKGSCLLYGFEKRGADKIAIIIINSKTKSSTEMKLNINGQKMSINSNTAGKEMQLVYFNVNKGRILEIVKDGSSEMNSETPMGGSGNTIINNKTTIKLI